MTTPTPTPTPTLVDRATIEALMRTGSPYQAVFDHIVRHLARQRRRSASAPAERTLMSLKPTCLYRGPEGTMCAVGALIPDELYHPEMEGQSARVLLLSTSAQNRRLVELFEQMIEPGGSRERRIRFFRQLQNAHDDASSWEPSGLSLAGIRRLAEIAAEFDLSPLVLDQLFPVTTTPTTES